MTKEEMKRFFILNVGSFWIAMQNPIEMSNQSYDKHS